MVSNLTEEELQSNTPMLVAPVSGSKLRHYVAIQGCGMCKFVLDEQTTNTDKWLQLAFNQRYDLPTIQRDRFTFDDGTKLSFTSHVQTTMDDSFDGSIT